MPVGDDGRLLFTEDGSIPVGSKTRVVARGASDAMDLDGIFDEAEKNYRFRSAKWEYVYYCFITFVSNAFTGSSVAARSAVAMTMMRRMTATTTMMTMMTTRWTTAARTARARPA